MRIMVTGGGTGGHTSPAVAVIQELQRRDPQLAVLWVGRPRSIEERICGGMAIPFRAIPVEGWPRTRKWRRPWVAAKLGVGLIRSWVLLKRYRPSIVFGVGGYVSLPLMLVAQRLEIPTALHEQNQLLGMANRLLAPRATHVFLSFPETTGEYPCERSTVVGNPVRSGFAGPPSQMEARAALDLDPAVPVVLIVGGSQGAHRINEAVTEIIPELGKGEVQIVWMTGKTDAPEARKAAAHAQIPIRVHPFIDDMAGACAAADLIVARAGASTAAELAMMGKPSLLIPYPYAAEGHQERNARALEEAGAAEVLLDAECTGERLLGSIRGLLADPDRLASMGAAAQALAKPGAADQIAEALLALVFERGGKPASP